MPFVIYPISKKTRLVYLILIILSICLSYIDGQVKKTNFRASNYSNEVLKFGSNQIEDINNLKCNKIKTFNTKTLGAGITPIIKSRDISNFVFSIALIVILIIWVYYAITYQKELLEKQRAEHLKLQKKSQYINYLTQELLTPLNLIDNNCLGKMKEVGTVNEFELINKSLKKVKNDLKNFIDYESLENCSKLYNHDMVCNLSKSLIKKNNIFREVLANKNIKIEEVIEDNLLIKCDPVAVNRIINNVIGNIINFTDNGGLIKVSLISGNRKIYFTLESNNLVIDEKQQKILFSPLNYFSNSNDNIQSFSLAFKIVEKILSEIRGTISLEKKVNSGTIVRLCFERCFEEVLVEQQTPLLLPKESYSYKADIKKYNKDKKHNILIVEENIALLDYLTLKLSEEYNAYSAINCQKGLNVIHKNPKIDLVIIDITMGVYDLFEKVKKIKALEATPVIVISANGNSCEKINWLSKGAIDYIYKPFNIAELVCKIDSILGFADKLRINSSELNCYKQSNETLFSKFSITKRESQIIKLAGAGRTNYDIAESLKISGGTVRKHLDNIYKKCNIHNRTELANIFSVI